MKKSIKITNKKNKKKIIIISAISIVLVLSIVVLITTGGLSKLMGNSITEYYCEDTSYKLEGNKCVKEIKDKSALLGDVNLDNKVTHEDLDFVKRYIDYIEYEEPDEEISKLTPLQIKAADVSEDNDVYNLDYDILSAYLESNASTHGVSEENIGVKRICSDGFKLEGTDCIKKDIVDAKIKTTEVNTTEDTSTSTTDTTNNNDNTNNSINNPVEISFKPEDNLTDLQINRNYKINVNFNVKDKNNKYYYIWKNYKYDTNDYSTECKLVTEGDHLGNFVVDGTRKVNVSVYSDAECKNQVATKDSNTYNCIGCTNQVDISLIPENDNIFLPKDSKYNINVKFDIHDKTHKYYYIWSNYLNGVNNYNTPCKEVVEGTHEGSISITGYRKIKVTVYSDSTCKSKIKDAESLVYTYEGISPEANNNVEAYATIEPLKYRFRDLATGKVVENSNIKNTNFIPINSDLFFKIYFLVKDNNTQYYYKWDDNGIYTNREPEHKCYPVPKSLSETKIVTLNPNYIPIYSDDETINKGYQANITLYKGPNCMFPIAGIPNNSISTNIYSFKNYTIRFDVNGGKINGSNAKTKDVVIGYNQKFKLPYNNYEGNTINANSGTFEIYKNGYDLIGFKAKNSKGLFLCYTNSKKTSKAFTNQTNCKKYGYYIYGKMDTLINVTPNNHEIITFYAQWTNNPVTINIDSLNYSKTYKKGTKLSSKATFKINDTHNTYYYKWGYVKTNVFQNIDKSVTNFVNKFDPYSIFTNYHYGFPDINNLDITSRTWGSWSFDKSPCKKITNNLTISPLIVVDAPITAGMILVYQDSSCRHIIYSEKPVHKITGLYKCNPNDINNGKCK